jgi:hypothetical protein
VDEAQAVSWWTRWRPRIRARGRPGSTARDRLALTLSPEMPRGSAILLVLAQPTEDRQAHAVKTLVKEQIASLPGLSAGPYRDDVTLPTAKGVRFDYSIDDPDLGILQVRSYLFRFGSDAYLVSFVALEEDFEAAEAIFEAIAASLRFGV